MKPTCLIGAVLISGALVLVPSTAVASTPPDAWITTKVKIALLTAPDVSPSAVHVDTVNGTVILYGKVRTDVEEATAVKLARRVEGAKGIRDLLQVVPPEEEKAVARTDLEITDTALRALRGDPRLSDSSISVKAVDKGVVLLEGTAASLTDYLSAVEDVIGAPGVRRVSSEVKTTELLSEPRMPPREVARSAAESAEAEHAPVRDAWITVATRMRLLADGRLPALDIGVETRNGVVTLFGTAPTEHARESAAEDVLAVDSANKVVNEIQVVPRARQEAVKIQDEAIGKSVRLAFKPYHELANVNVNVSNAVVHLSGSVSSQWQRVRAATLARAAPGVSAVDDDLAIERPRASL